MRASLKANRSFAGLLRGLVMSLAAYPRLFLHVNAWLMPLLFAAVMGYLAYHAFASDRGLFALSRLQAEKTRVEAELTQTRAEREAMERRVQHMSPESLDMDLVDEQSRRVLGTSDADEMVIVVPPKKPAQ